MATKAPLSHQISVREEGAATAVDDTFALGRAPFAGSVSRVTFASDAAITGANTNTRRLSLMNRGQDGTGTTEIAAIQFNAGVNAPAFDEVVLPLSGTPANLNVNEGDILAFFSDSIGTGIADPGGLVTVDLSRSTATL